MYKGGEYVQRYTQETSCCGGSTVRCLTPQQLLFSREQFHAAFAIFHDDASLTEDTDLSYQAGGHVGIMQLHDDEMIQNEAGVRGLTSLGLIGHILLHLL